MTMIHLGMASREQLWAFWTEHRLYTDGPPPPRAGAAALIDVRDVCEALIVAMEAPNRGGTRQVFHAGSNQGAYQISGLAEIVRSVVPGCEIEYVTDHDADQRTYIADFTKIETALPAFQPTWTAEQEACDLYQAYLRLAMIQDRFTGCRYIRVKRIDQLINGR